MFTKNITKFSDSPNLVTNFSLFTLVFLYVLESSHPFLAPIVRHQVSVTPQGLEEMEHKPESHENQGFTCEGNIMSEISKESLVHSGDAKDTKI